MHPLLKNRKATLNKSFMQEREKYYVHTTKFLGRKKRAC